MYINGFEEKDLCFDPEYAQEILDEVADNEYTFSEAMYEIVLAMLLNKYKTKVLKVYNKR